MFEQFYSIVMKTPLGKKYGILEVSVSENILSGWLDILGHKEPFNGIIDSNGNCSVNGTFITLMRTVSFSATGKLTASAVNLQIKDERNVFELSGVACSNPEERQV